MSFKVTFLAMTFVCLTMASISQATVNLSAGVYIDSNTIIRTVDASAAGALAAIPAMAVGSAVKFQATALAKKLGSGAVSTGRFATKPFTNPIVGRAELFRKRIEPKLSRI